MNNINFKCPKNELRWTAYTNIDGEIIFRMTSNLSREIYYLYEFIDNEFKKVGRGRTPIELEEKFNIVARLQK